jgi:hypothetical protein
MLDWLVRVFNALSQLCNVVFLNGHPNESISGRSYRENWKLRHVIDAILWFDEDHCMNSHLNERVWSRYILSLDR